jgi:hypothetical protein
VNESGVDSRPAVYRGSKSVVGEIVIGLLERALTQRQVGDEGL